MLSNTFILDLADSEGGFCSKVMADLGARTVKIKTPDADPAISSSRDFARLLFSYHNTNKSAVVLDPGTPDGKQGFGELLSKADVLIESFSAGRLKSLEFDSESPESSNPRLIWILLPEQTSYPESIYGAIAAVLSLRKRKITGNGCRIDLSIWKAGNDTLDYRAADHRDRQFQILPCKDGFIQLPIFRNWETLVELMNAEQIAIDPIVEKWKEDEGWETHIGQIAHLVEEWTRRHTKRELFELGQAMRFPWAPVATPEEVLKSPQLRARRFFVPAVRLKGSPAIPFPGAPYKFSAYAPQCVRSFEDMEIRCDKFLKKEGILGGLRVLDLTRMISGPYATRLLADFGAEVIKIQSRETARGAEQNDTAHFAVWNRNKRSLCLDLDHAEARELFIRLVAISDVVVENFSPRVMPNWGLDFFRLRQVKPNLIMASISAMGQTGPWRNFVGFAPTFHALSGLLSIVSHSSDVPADIQNPYADIVTALYSALAILAAVANRDRTGEGRHIDISGYEATCTMIGPALIACAAGINANEYRQNVDWTSLLRWEEKPENWEAAPALGQDNHSIIVDLLGCTETDYESFLAKGIL